jgi:HD superfamily phosphohydrolase YqeK
MNNPLVQICESMGSISNDSIRSWTMSLMTLAPQAFWAKPSSSTGKYHKEDENGEYGQVIHTLRVIAVAEHLAKMVDLNDLEKNILISAAALHDICKYGIEGQSEHTLSEHPQLVKSLWEKNLLVLPKCEYDHLIIGTILQHSGRWGSLPLPPSTKLGKLLHVADFISSRNNIEVNLEKTMEYLGE